jgi:Do/DeqQ family serine protease
MKRQWLLFSQVVTVLVAMWFVVATLKPEWLNLRSTAVSGGVTLLEAAPNVSGAPMPGSFSPAAKLASPAVVSIATTQANAPAHPLQNDPWFRFFYGDREDEAPQQGLGSGVIVSPEGYILTNNHVIEGAAEIQVTLSDSRRAIAQVIGADPETDLAILRITLDRLPVITLGNSDTAQVGDRVLAIGNPFGVGQTVTSGIVSALGRNQLGINTFENFIQTDAAINPGNSGGALVDVNGNLIGINTAIYSRSGGNMGIGFAIPVSTARQVLEGIVRDGQVVRGWVGIEPMELTAELAETFGLPKQSEGVIVTGVLQNGPAANAGLRPGDLLLKVAGQPVKNVGELLTQIASLTPGKAAKLDVMRRNQTLTLDVTPAQRPKPKIQK